MKKAIRAILILAAIILPSLILVSFWPPQGIVQKIEWGVAFSKPFAVAAGLNWKESYLAVLDDLKAKNIRLPIYWSDTEIEKNHYDFSSYDWMAGEAGKRGVGLILVFGRKLPRWPECHEPDWAASLDEKSQEEKILALDKKIIERYKDLPNLKYWQVENEPFLLFGECSQTKAQFLDQEISLAHSLDSRHPVLVTDSGELGLWFYAVSRGDIFGTTMYRTIWNKYLGYFTYPLPPQFFWLKANLIRLFYPGKPIIVSELQEEPWGPKLSYESPLEDEFKSLNINQFRANIEYAKQVGFPEVYLWGAEWWYWMKTKQSHPEFWNSAKELFSSN